MKKLSSDKSNLFEIAEEFRSRLSGTDYFALSVISCDCYGTTTIYSYDACLWFSL